MASDINFSYKGNKGLFNTAQKIKLHFTPHWLLFYTFFFHSLNGTEPARQLPSLLTNNLLGWQRCRREKQPPPDDPTHAQPFLEGAENDWDKSKDTSLELSWCVSKARGMRLTLTWVIARGMTEKELFCRGRTRLIRMKEVSSTSKMQQKKVTRNHCCCNLQKEPSRILAENVQRRKLRISRTLRDVNCDSR